MLQMGRKHKYSKTKGIIFDRLLGKERKSISSPNMNFDYVIEIKESVVDCLRNYCQVEGNEIGGILTGSIISEKRIRISNVSMPCSIKRFANRYKFVRDAAKANEFIKRDFEQSVHTRVYVGEWHTHPEENPSPSSVDIDSIVDIYNRSDIVINGVFLIIVGLKSNYYGFCNGILMKKVNITIV